MKMKSMNYEALILHAFPLDWLFTVSFGTLLGFNENVACAGKALMPDGWVVLHLFQARTIDVGSRGCVLVA